MSDDTENAAQRHEDELLRLKNVVGVAGGGDRILVLVRQKEPLSALVASDVVPETIDGLDTDVIEVGDIEAMTAVGSSIGLRSAGTGTLGAIVEDDFRRYILTNNHVAANTNLAKMLEAVHHPGPADGLGGIIGRLARYEPIYFNRDNWVDAALIEVPDPSQWMAKGYFPRQTATARVSWDVHKTGRTTGRTDGEVIGRNATVRVDYGTQGTATFRGQILTDHMLDPGDSGSVLASRNGYAVALSFAGSDRVSIHTPINTVLNLLSVNFA